MRHTGRFIEKEKEEEKKKKEEEEKPYIPFGDIRKPWIQQQLSGRQKGAAQKKYSLKTEEQIWDWTGKYAAKWKKLQIKDLQKKLGLEPTGKYDFTTQQAHVDFFKNRALGGYSSAQQTMQANTAAIQKQEYEKRLAAVQERRVIKDQMFAFYQDYFGHAPSPGTMADLVDKREKGWGFDEIDRRFRANPEFKRKHPGITDQVTLPEYDELRNKIFGNFIATRGRPPKPHEIADVLAGRAKPITGSFGDQPTFRIDPNLGGI